MNLFDGEVEQNLIPEGPGLDAYVVLSGSGMVIHSAASTRAFVSIPDALGYIDQNAFVALHLSGRCNQHRLTQLGEGLGCLYALRDLRVYSIEVSDHPAACKGLLTKLLTSSGGMTDAFFDAEVREGRSLLDLCAVNIAKLLPQSTQQDVDRLMVLQSLHQGLYRLQVLRQDIPWLALVQKLKMRLGLVFGFHTRLDHVQHFQDLCDRHQVFGKTFVVPMQGRRCADWTHRPIVSINRLSGVNKREDVGHHLDAAIKPCVLSRTAATFTDLGAESIRASMLARPQYLPSINGRTHVAERKTWPLLLDVTAFIGQSECPWVGRDAKKLYEQFAALAISDATAVFANSVSLPIMVFALRYLIARHRQGGSYAASQVPAIKLFLAKTIPRLSAAYMDKDFQSCGLSLQGVANDLLPLQVRSPFQYDIFRGIQSLDFSRLSDLIDEDRDRAEALIRVLFTYFVMHCAQHSQDNTVQSICFLDQIGHQSLDMVHVARAFVTRCWSFVELSPMFSDPAKKWVYDVCCYYLGDGQVKQLSVQSNHAASVYQEGVGVHGGNAEYIKMHMSLLRCRLQERSAPLVVYISYMKKIACIQPETLAGEDPVFVMKMLGRYWQPSCHETTRCLHTALLLMMVYCLNHKTPSQHIKLLGLLFDKALFDLVWGYKFIFTSHGKEGAKLWIHLYVMLCHALMKHQYATPLSHLVSRYVSLDSAQFVKMATYFPDQSSAPWLLVMRHLVLSGDRFFVTRSLGMTLLGHAKSWQECLEMHGIDFFRSYYFPRMLSSDDWPVALKIRMYHLFANQSPKTPSDVAVLMYFMALAGINDALCAQLTSGMTALSHRIGSTLVPLDSNQVLPPAMLALLEAVSTCGDHEQISVVCAIEDYVRAFMNVGTIAGRQHFQGCMLPLLLIIHAHPKLRNSLDLGSESQVVQVAQWVGMACLLCLGEMSDARSDDYETVLALFKRAFSLIWHKGRPRVLLAVLPRLRHKDIRKAVLSIIIDVKQGYLQCQALSQDMVKVVVDGIGMMSEGPGQYECVAFSSWQSIVVDAYYAQLCFELGCDVKQPYHMSILEFMDGHAESTKLLDHYQHIFSCIRRIRARVGDGDGRSSVVPGEVPMLEHILNALLQSSLPDEAPQGLEAELKAYIKRYELDVQVLPVCDVVPDDDARSLCSSVRSGPHSRAIYCKSAGILFAATPSPSSLGVGAASPIQIQSPVLSAARKKTVISSVPAEQDMPNSLAP